MTAGRIGVFGGAFDPPHNAHVALAAAALAQFELNALLIVPTGQAWHKARTLSAAEHRLAMARLAFESQSRVVVDDRELQRAGPSFTIDTLRALQAEHPQAQLHLLIGADQLADFRQWRSWCEILDIAIVCIADRVQLAGDTGTFDARFDGYAGLRHRFLTLELPLMPVSATRVRELVASGAPEAEIARLVPEAVARYISANRLYCGR